jgi:hypothetical protein
VGGGSTEIEGPSFKTAHSPGQRLLLAVDLLFLGPGAGILRGLFWVHRTGVLRESQLLVQSPRQIRKTRDAGSTSSCRGGPALHGHVGVEIGLHPFWD